MSGPQCKTRIRRKRFGLIDKGETMSAFTSESLERGLGHTETSDNVLASHGLWSANARLLSWIDEEANSSYPELRSSLRVLERQDVSAHRILLGALRRFQECVFHFRVPRQMRVGDEFICEDSGWVMVVETVRTSGGDTWFRFRIEDGSVDVFADVFADVETGGGLEPLESMRLDDRDIWRSEEISGCSLELIGGLLDVPIRVSHRLFAGEVISAESDEVTCWLELESGERIESALAREMFDHVGVAPSTEFLWSPCENWVAKLDRDDPLLVSAVGYGSVPLDDVGMAAG